MICILKFTKGNNFVKTAGGGMVLALCTSSDDALYLYKVLWKYLKEFQSNRCTNRHKLALCTSSDDALYLQSFVKVSQRVSE